MEIPKEIKEKAIEGGFNPVLGQAFESYGITEAWRFYVTTPSWWQALGKALGWYMSVFKDGKFSKEHSIYPNPLEVAHDFFDLILTNQDTAAYWESLIGKDK